MPYGLIGDEEKWFVATVSIPHMGCMPYGPTALAHASRVCTSFNPSYGLHALRAKMPTNHFFAMFSFNPSYGLHALRALLPSGTTSTNGVSIPHMGCMPYGRSAWGAQRSAQPVSIPHMGCMPYGLDISRLGESERDIVSIPHMGCMPYGHRMPEPY